MSYDTDTPSDSTGTSTNEVRRYTRFARTWTTWVGDVDDLARLGRDCQKLYEKRKQLHEAQQQRPKVREQPKQPDGGSFVYGEFHIWSDDSRPGFEMTVLDGPDRISGSIGAVMTELDRRTVNQVSFTGNISENDMLSASLRRKPSGNTSVVELKVESEDAGWAREALAHLSEQVDRAQPKWAWMHSRNGVRLFGLLNLLVLSIPVSVIHATLGWSVEFAPVLTFWAVFAVLLVLTASRPLLRLLLPPFEVVRPGMSPRGSKFVVYLITALVGFAGSVVASVIT